LGKQLFRSDVVDLEKLTSRECEVLYLLHDGFNDTDIAKQLCISHVTVRSHVANILRKLQIKSNQVKHLSLPTDK